MQFYIYIDGYDLDDCADRIGERILDFIAPYGDRVVFINEREPLSDSEDLPVWNLGVNFHDDSLSESEKKDLVFFFHLFSSECGREFILGARRETDMPENYFTISEKDSIEPAVSLLKKK